MLANDMKKGQLGTLHNGWNFKIEDNKKGVIRMCTVYGAYTEMGSVYIHDMNTLTMPDGSVEKIEFSDRQQKQIDKIKTALSVF